MLEGSVKVDSIVVKDENLAAHLKSPDFFDSAVYPEISFRSDAVELGEDGSLEVEGELTIKGRTHRVTGARLLLRPAHRHRRQRQDRRRARGRDRPPRVRPGVERAAAEGRLRARQRRQARGRASSSCGRPRAMRMLGLAGSLRAGLPTTPGCCAARARCSRPAPSWSSTTGSARSRRTTRTTSSRSRPAVAALQGRDRARPTPCWWRRPSTTARSRARSRTRSTGSRARPPASPLRGQARGRDRGEHGPVRGGLGAGRAAQGARHRCGARWSTASCRSPQAEEALGEDGLPLEPTCASSSRRPSTSSSSCGRCRSASPPAASSIGRRRGLTRPRGARRAPCRRRSPWRDPERGARAYTQRR